MKHLASHLNKTLGLASIAAGAAAFPLAVSAAAKAPSQPAPNIVFILADDLGWTDLGCQGSKYYETPNIDRLASEGIRFTSAYTCPNCAPTRACLMTGKYSPRTGIYTVGTGNRGQSYDRKLKAPANKETLSLDIPIIPEMLRGSGYLMGIAGKWHLGSDIEHGPAARGFDTAVWRQGGAHFNYRTIPEVPHPQGQYLTDFLADQGIEFMRKARRENKPFLLVLTHFAVHTPLQAPKDVVDYFKSKPPAGGHKNPVYAAMIKKLDESVGRVVKEIDDLGIAGNTIIIFTSDNGGVTHKNGDEKTYITSNAPLRGGKGMHYEGGYRVPFIARWNGVIKPGATCDTPIAAIDFAPTVFDLTGHQPPSGVVIDGLSYAPLLKGRSDKKIEDRALYWHFPVYLEGSGETEKWRSTPGGMIRQGPWKLMERYETGKIELYNLAADLSETTDLSEKQPEKAAELLAKLRQWREELKGAMPVPNPNYQKESAKKAGKKKGGKKNEKKSEE